jgi:CRISPR-associated endoribonuclease Cas6
MRLLLRLEALKDQAYNKSYNHYVQSFFYNLIRNTEFNHLHDFRGTSPSKKAITTFCFSNLFPYGDMHNGDKKNLIISSPDERLIFLLYDTIKLINNPIHLGGMQFYIANLKVFQLHISFPLAVTSVTPIIVRIPRSIYQNYNLDLLKYPYEYIFWRQSYPLELFLSQIEMNMRKKYINNYNCTPESSLGLKKFIFKQQISRKLNIRGTTQTIIATYWKFWFEEDQKLIRFGLDAGFGERNRLGFGFMDTC